MNSEYETVAERRALGAKVQEFRTRAWGQFARGCLGLCCMALGTIAVVAAVLQTLQHRAPPSWIFVAIAVLSFSGGVGLFRTVRDGSRTRVELFAGGLVLHEGSTIESCTWKEIRVVVEKESVESNEAIAERLRNETHAFHLHLESGRSIILKSYLHKLGRLGEVIKRETLPHLLPPYRDALRTGRGVEFGPIRLNCEGIELDWKTLPWSELGRIVRDGGWLNIKKRGAWFAWKKVRLNEVPNAHVLQEIVSQRFYPQHVS